MKQLKYSHLLALLQVHPAYTGFFKAALVQYNNTVASLSLGCALLYFNDTIDINFSFLTSDCIEDASLEVAYPPPIELILFDCY